MKTKEDEMDLPQPQGIQFSSIIARLKEGQIKIPQFQRDFVWNIKKSAYLLDSILKGYPIGTFIFWKTKERLRFVRDIGGIKFPEPKKGDFLEFVLDGQQRLTSLFACLYGVKIERDNRNIDDFGDIYIDLKAEENEEIVVIGKDDEYPQKYIGVNDLYEGDFQRLSEYPKEYHKKIREYQNRLNQYNYSVIYLNNASLDTATEVFTRLNVEGKPLTLFQIMVAKTFDPSKDFDLSIKWDSLIDRLRDCDYETISDASVLQLISLILTKPHTCKRTDILKLNKEKFIKAWPKCEEALYRAVDYFRDTYRIEVSKLLPYNSLIVPFAYYFYLHPDKPLGEQKKYLEDYFWRCALSGRYSSSVENKLAQDIERIEEIIKNKLPNYEWGMDTSPEFIIQNGWFSAGRSYIKGILSIYAYHEPKSFIDNSKVRISNDWLKQANSKNYHHFFPKAYLKKQGIEDGNHVLNITIVDDYLNKRAIRASAPSSYMRKFAKDNEEINTTMKSHLIRNLDRFGVWNDDYERFLKERAKVVSREIRKRIIPREVDSLGQVELGYDYEESEIE